MARTGLIWAMKLRKYKKDPLGVEILRQVLHLAFLRIPATHEANSIVGFVAGCRTKSICFCFWSFERRSASWKRDALLNDTLILNWSGPEEAPEHEMRSRAQRDSVDGFMQLFLAMLNLRVGNLLCTGIDSVHVEDLVHLLPK